MERRNTMQAVILAAGCGRRMRPLSDSCHKALLTVGESTVISRLVADLLALGVSTVNVVTGYRAADVEQHLTAAYPGAPLRFIRNECFAETNNVVSLALALEALEPGHDIALIECDLLLAPGILARVCGRGRDNVALLDRYRAGMAGTVVTIAQGVVTAVFPPGLQHEKFEYGDTYKTVNVYRFTDAFIGETLAPLVAKYAERVDANGYYECALATLPDLAPLGIQAEFVGDDFWAEIDDPADLFAARLAFSAPQRGDSTHQGVCW